MDELRQQTASGDIEPRGRSSSSSPADCGSSARRRARRLRGARARRRPQPQPLDGAHAQVAERARAHAARRKTPGQSAAVRPHRRWLLVRRCSASPTGCCATSGACEDIGSLLAGKMLVDDRSSRSAAILLLSQPHHRAVHLLPREGPRHAGRGAGGLAPVLPGQAARDDGALVVDGGAARVPDPHGVRHRVLTAGRSFPSSAFAAFAPFLVLPAVLAAPSSPCCW